MDKVSKRGRYLKLSLRTFTGVDIGLMNRRFQVLISLVKVPITIKRGN